MLETTKYKLASMYGNQPQLGADGTPYQLDANTRISMEQGHVLAAIHSAIKPQLSIEIGLAYGFSTLFIMDSLFQTGRGRHIAIDPFQDSAWHGIGRQAVEEMKFACKFEHNQKMSVTALTEMYESGLRTDYIYVDGGHNFDTVMVDFYCSNRLLNVGGVLLFDDMWMPSIQKIASFIRKNMRGYREFETPVKNLLCLKKLAEDDRAWDHFSEF